MQARLHYLRPVLCLVLAACLLLAACPPVRAVAVADDLLVAGAVIAGLSAMGITLSSAGAVAGDIVDEVGKLLTGVGHSISDFVGDILLPLPGIYKVTANFLGGVADIARDLIGRADGDEEVPLVSPVATILLVSGIQLPYTQRAGNYNSTNFLVGGVPTPIYTAGQSRKEILLGNGYKLAMYMSSSNIVKADLLNANNAYLVQATMTVTATRNQLYLSRNYDNSANLYTVEGYYDAYSGGAGTTIKMAYGLYNRGSVYIPSACITGYAETGLSLSAGVSGAAIPDYDTEADSYLAIPGLYAGTADTMSNALVGSVADDRPLAAAAIVSTPAEAERVRDRVPAGDDGDYRLSLTGIFPFCVPFDIYRLISALDAEPVAPSIIIDLSGISLGGTHVLPDDAVLTIDLSPFNSAAGILRTMLVLAFCVGLAILTSKMIRW